MAKEPRPSSEKGLRDIFLAAAAGAAGTAAVGLIFSSTTLSWLGHFMSSNIIPPGAIMFVSGTECGNGWQKFDIAPGRFVVAAGKSPDSGQEFQSGLTGNGRSKIKLRPENLPDFNIEVPYTTTNVLIEKTGYNIVVGVGGDKANNKGPVRLGGKGEEIDTLPSWIALTACRWPRG